VKERGRVVFQCVLANRMLLVIILVNVYERRTGKKNDGLTAA
jgi:hypothetical protein